MRRLMVAGGAAVAFALVAGVAEAKVIPQKSIAAIELGMVRAEVVDRKGEPDRERIVEHEIFGSQRIMRYGKTKVGFAGKRPRSQVVAVSTRSPRQRTNTGVGVGSTEFEVESSIKGIRCRNRFGARACIKGELRPGQRVTEFLISKTDEVVTRVTVAIVVD